jgi:hypothetical protein
MTREKQKLELTWIGKENRARLEPWILLEDPEKSYHAPHRVTDKDIFDNRLLLGTICWPGRLVLCSAFRGKSDRFPNLTIKKIPNTVLKRCEWGHDDYSLRVENLPNAPPKPGQLPLFGKEEE